MRILNEFPEHRRADPKRRAEMQSTTSSPAAAPPEPPYTRSRRTATLLRWTSVWIEDSARFGMQVKGGRYTIEGGRWFLHTNGEREPIQDPVKLTWDAAMSIRAALWTKGRYKVYMVAVLVFPDMPEPDPQIQEWADNCKVNPLWGSENLVERLIEFHDVGGIYSPPTARHIEAEVAVLMPGLAEDLPRAAAEGPPAADPPAMGLTARQVVIQHADVVNVYTVGVAADDGGAAPVAG